MVHDGFDFDRRAFFRRVVSAVTVAGVSGLLLGKLTEPAYAATNVFPNDGYVGIGTTSPSQLLEISGSSEPFIAITNTGMSGSPRLYIGMNGGNNAALFQATNGKDFKFYNGQYTLRFWEAMATLASVQQALTMH